MVVPQGPVEGVEAAKPAECEANCAHHRPVRLSWARLLKRVFEIDLEHCPARASPRASAREQTPLQAA